MGGENPAARIWKNTNRLADQIRTEAQLVVQGLKSPGQIKRELMHDYDVSFHQAERLIDTEISYVLNKANLEQYRRYGVGKVTIVNLDVNTCEKCKALEGQVFRIEDAPVLPIHPRCHCSYCVPAEGDDAEVTASGSDLASVYADAGVEGYERVPAGGGRKIVFSMAEIRSEPEVLRSGVESGIMPASTEAAGDGVRTIARIENEAITQRWGKVIPEVVLTDERIEHIREGHAEDYEAMRERIPEIIQYPSFILEDNRVQNTAMFIKHIETTNANVVVKLEIEDQKDDPELLSSVITMFRLGNRSLKRLLKKYPVLYKSEEL